MGKKEQKDQKSNERVEAVLHLLRKQSPLSLTQEKFCNNACVERFLRAKGENVKKAAKQLRACLSWRETLCIEKVTADEFSAELAEGVAYLAGHDEESRPVLIFRIKQDYQKFHSQKLFARLLAFTLEVAISTMSKNVEQFVLLIDASFFRSASGFMNLLLATLKIVAEYYPFRLYKAFLIDPPSFFSYLWKGARPFVELSTVTMVVSSLDFQDSFAYDFSSYPSRTSSLRFDDSSIKSTAKMGPCSSSRFAFTVSHHSFDSLKPWSLTLTDTSSSKVGPSSAVISPLTARSFSFASPATRSEPRCGKKKSMFASTPMPESTTRRDSIQSLYHERVPRASFLLRKECHVSSKTERPRESFVPFLKFYGRPYDEMAYRAKMRPPLGGLISTVSSHIGRRHVSVSQRF